MSENEFTLVVAVTFVVIVIGVSIGFSYFIRWYRRETGTRPTEEALLKRQTELEDRFHRLHPDAEDDSSPS